MIIDDFVAAAREFTGWCLSPPFEEDAEARRALPLLVRLYALALELRWPEEIEADLDGDRADDETWRKVYECAAALPFNYYSSVFDPQVIPPETAGIDDLADDIADIHRDLSEGLSLYDAGHVAAAEWDFMTSFRSHWGRHASSAIHALHCWMADADEWD